MRRRFQDHMVGGCSNGVFLEVGLRVDLSPAIQRFGECDFHLLGSKTFELKCITRKLPEKDSQRDLNLTRPSFKMDKFLYGTSQASFFVYFQSFSNKNYIFLHPFYVGNVQQFMVLGFEPSAFSTWVSSHKSFCVLHNSFKSLPVIVKKNNLICQQKGLAFVYPPC